jgi:chromosome partitioning protein
MNLELGRTPKSPGSGAAPRIIVFGNEKGGSGKSTAAVQVAIGLLRRGHAVATLDLDARQGTLSRYMSNREAHGGLPMPVHAAILPSKLNDLAQAAAADREAFETTLSGLGNIEFVIADTPGNDTGLSRLAHARADTLVTPINDSFIDFDLLARVDPKTRRILGPSVYAELVWDRRKERAMARGAPIDWIVMRNRLGHSEARNKREMGEALDELARRIGFRVAQGFGERVIFRELFLSGLTLFDLGASVGGPALAMSHVAGRQEARALIDAILAGPPRRNAPAPAQ